MGWVVLALAIVVAIVAASQRNSNSSSTTGSNAANTASVTPTSPGATDRAPSTSEFLAPRPARPPRGDGPGLAPVGTIVLGAWNIEWLGAPAKRSGPAQNVAQDPRELAEVIRESGVHVLALAEIVTDVRGKPVRSREIEAIIEHLAAAGQTWDYALAPPRQTGDQMTGVMWNTRVVTAINDAGKPWDQSRDQMWPVPVPMRQRAATGGTVWARPPHAIKFSAGKDRSDFVVIPVHMKADYQGDFSAQRKEEAQALIAQLPAIRAHFTDKDVMILGDTNADKHAEPAIVAFVGAGLTDLNARDQHTHWRSGSMDRALVPADQPEFAASTFSVFANDFMAAHRLRPADWKRRFSDHYLITSTMKIEPDDD
jgi:hypothetical protein